MPLSQTTAVRLEPTVPPDRTGRRRDSAVIGTLAFAGVSVAVMQSLLLPVVSRLPGLLHTSAGDATWIMTATLLAAAVSTPITGRLGDLYGKRRMVLAGLVLMAVGSLVSAATSDYGLMIVGRALQGMAIGVVPLGIGIMRDVVPPERLGVATGLMSSSVGVGGALCLPAAAFVAEHADWHVLFLATAGLGALAAALVAMVVPASHDRAPGRFDFAGALTLSLAMVCLLLAITEGAAWGWLSGTTLTLLLGAALLLAGFGVLELRREDPLVDLRATARRPVLLANTAALGVGIAYYAVSLTLPQLLQLPAETGHGLGMSMVGAGLVMAPTGLAMMAVSPLSALLTARRGPRTALLAGLTVIAVSCAAGALLLGSVGRILVLVTAVGAGIGLAYAAMPALIMGSVDASETGAANGLNTLMRFVGTSLSSSVIGTVLAQMTLSVDGTAVPSLRGCQVALLLAAAAVLAVLAASLFLREGTDRGGRTGEC
ncbi:MFS transporter [Streptomyces sp. NPDC017988]|uniref:MFS transporter n=1 Tax=Streptomyces sp. NPDC017988 TaxID=3365025 RepID=UPI0037A5DCF0